MWTKKKEQLDSEVDPTFVQDHSEENEEMEDNLNEEVTSSKGNGINHLYNNKYVVKYLLLHFHFNYF